VRFVVLDGCPVPVEAAGFISEAKRRSGQSLNSCFRGAEAKALLAKLGKKDQATLYWGWVRRLPGYNPANPPRLSTHECFCDGLFPPGYRRGQRIPPECVGQDWTNGSRVVGVYRSMGIPAVLPYSDVRERHHVGIPRPPKAFDKARPTLQPGDKSVWTISLQNKLSFVAMPRSGGRRYFTGKKRGLTYGPITQRAVMAYQHDHGLRPDGVVGDHTWNQLNYSVAWFKKHRKATPKTKTVVKAVKKTPGLSSNGAKLIARFEGWRATPYNDPSGYSTVGYGHLIARRNVNAADRRGIWVKGQDHAGVLTPAEGLALLRQDASIASAVVQSSVKVPLTQNQRDALIAFTFNVGTGAFKDSTLLRKLNHKDYRGAASEFGTWTHSGGRELPGLVTRRKAEAALFRK
jgi:lysozyme